MCLNHLPGPGHSVSWVRRESTDPESRSQAVTLLVDANRSEAQEDVASSWEPAHSLVEDAISGTHWERP